MSTFSDLGLYKYEQRKGNTVFLKVSATLAVFTVILFTVCFATAKVIYTSEPQPTNSTIYSATTSNYDVDILNTTATVTETSKLISLNTLQDNLATAERKQFPPRPFLQGMTGPEPSSFVPITWAQLNHYKSPQNYPKNIREVMKYVTGHKDTSMAISPLKNDPFYQYKPPEPSDINLLATTNFKFAPPVWQSLRHPKSLPPTTNIMNQLIPLTTKEHPMSVTLNVFPMQGQLEPSMVNHISMPSAPSGILQRIKNSFAYDKIVPEPKMMPKDFAPRKLTLHLNLFPDADIYRGLAMMQRKSGHEHVMQEREEPVDVATTVIENTSAMATMAMSVLSTERP